MKKENDIIYMYINNNVLDMDKIINDFSPYLYTIIENAGNFKPEDIEEFKKDSQTKNLVLFYNSNCLWCHEREKLLIELSKELKDVYFYILNCKFNYKFCKENNIRTTPQLFIYQGKYSKKCYDSKYDLIKKFILEF